MRYFFVADEHFGHANIIKYSNRPFTSVEHMDETLIENHNSVVGSGDVVIHGGDFSLIRGKATVFKRYISRLVGKHVFLRGSHDVWLSGNMASTRWEKRFGEHYIVVDHYSMRAWPRSHYNSWQLYGHSHGRLPPQGKQHDIGVDNNNFFPVSLEEVVEIMATRPDNFNLVPQKKY